MTVSWRTPYAKTGRRRISILPLRRPANPGQTGHHGSRCTQEKFNAAFGALELTEQGYLKESQLEPLSTPH